jgi:hypothetical protein
MNTSVLNTLLVFYWELSHRYTDHISRRQHFVLLSWQLPVFRTPPFSHKVEKQMSRAYAQLLQKGKIALMEEDLVAVYFLGMLGALRGSSVEFVCHLQGFASIMKILK